MAGAGVFADVLTISECGAHPLAVVTAQVVQDSHGVHSWAGPDVQSLIAGTRSALLDGRPDAIKIGMLGNAEALDAVTATLVEFATPKTWVVIDPVLASGGDAPMASAHLADALLPALRTLGDAGLSVVLTPNAPELGRLLRAGTPETRAELQHQAATLSAGAECVVLAKGGHILDCVGTDFLVGAGERVEYPPLEWPDNADIHGTGCALSSALAVELGRGTSLAQAVVAARDTLAAKVMASVQIGSGRRQLGPFRSRN